jgi:hypothetical protein
VTRVLLHIGSHKTGTTYLQQGFVALRPALRDAGIDYPSAWQDHLHGHHSLVRALARDDAGTGDRLRDLADQADRQGLALLLSSENFETLGNAAVQRLAAALAGHAVEVVYFARRWSGLLPSAWQEDVKQGGEATYPAFLLNHLADPQSSSLLNHAIVLDRYAQAFGQRAIRVVAYDGVIEAGDDLLEFFARRILQVRIDPPAAKGRVNRALPPVDVEIIRTLNVMARLSGGTLPAGVWPMRLFYDLGAGRLAAIATLRDTLGAHLVEHRLPGDLPACREIEAHTAERFGPILPAGGPTLFGTAQAIIGHHVDGAYWTNPAVPPAFAQLCDAMCRRHGQLVAA